MESAVRLSLSLPMWYLSLATHPLVHGLLTVIPIIGVPALAVALLNGQLRYGYPPLVGGLAVCHLFVFMAGLMTGRLDISATGIAITSFVAAQLIVFRALMRRRRLSAGPPIALGLFTASYAAGAAYLAAEAFTGTMASV